MFNCSKHPVDQRKGILLMCGCVVDVICMMGFYKFDPDVV